MIKKKLPTLIRNERAFMTQYLKDIKIIGNVAKFIPANSATWSKRANSSEETIKLIQ